MGGLFKSVDDAALSRGVFRVNESFVKSNLEGRIGEEERVLMKTFIEQTVVVPTEGRAIDGKAPVLCLYYHVAPIVVRVVNEIYIICRQR